MVNNVELFEEAKGVLYGLQRIQDSARTEYIVRLQTPNAGLVEKFAVALSGSVAEFTPLQKELIRDAANPKALRMIPDINDVSEFTGFLRHCFSDSCGHLLSARFLYDKHATSELGLRSSLAIASKIVTGLAGVNHNFALFFSIHAADSFSELEIIHQKMEDVISAAQENLPKLAHALGVDEAEWSEIQAGVVQDLASTTSISYLSPIDPALWRG